MTKKTVEFYILLKDFKKIRETLKTQGVLIKEFKERNCYNCNKWLSDNDYVKFKVFIKNKISSTTPEDPLLEIYCEDCVKNS